MQHARKSKGRRASVDSMDEDEYDNLMPPAFLVCDGSDGEEMDMNAPPTSGMEYLRRVQQEVKSVPAIVVADVSHHIKQAGRPPPPPISIHQIQGIQPAPKGCCPSLEWQQLQVSRFSEVRQSFAHEKAKLIEAKVKKPRKLPLKEDGESWCRLCFGQLNVKRNWRSSLASTTSRGFEFKSPSSSHPPLNENSLIDSELSTNDIQSSAISSASIADPDQSEACVQNDGQVERNLHGAKEQGTPPLLSIMAYLDQATVAHVIKYHIDWMSVTGFSADQGRWLYSLMVCLEKPLDPDVCSLLRDLARSCAKQRASIAPGIGSANAFEFRQACPHKIINLAALWQTFLVPDALPEENSEDAHVVQLNLLICIVARYFQQSDLADNPA